MPRIPSRSSSTNPRAPASAKADPEFNFNTYCHARWCGGTGPGGVKRARIEIIPLIDVIFFLLATFVLFTLSLNKSNGVKVALPVSTTGVPRDTGGTVTVSVTDEGAIAWNHDLVTLDEFLQRLQQFHREDPEGRILINGDEKAFFAQAIYIFDEARKAGFTKVYVETRSK